MEYFKGYNETKFLYKKNSDDKNIHGVNDRTGGQIRDRQSFNPELGS